MAQIVLITNAWGPKYGGINSFNTDFAKALSAVLSPYTGVTCVVMFATEDEVEDAAKAGVKLLSLGAKDSERVDESRAINVLDAVRQNGSDEVLWWVGHDVFSGGAAVVLPKKACQGKSVVIHHMSYVDYTAYKQGSAIAAKRKQEDQRRIFQQADEVFAVGPLLRDSLTDLLEGSKSVRMLVPGLAEIEPAPSSKTFSAITFGRLDPENDRIKQGRLAIAGFAVACREANLNKLYPKLLRENPRLLVVGVSSESNEEQELRALSSKRAGRVINLLPIPYEEDRVKLFSELKRSSIAMMLSWHEGFGLTGWEAIAAEVPLIVSRKSGLYKLIDETLGAPGLACLKHVDVRGELGDLAGSSAENFHPDDEKDVSQAILELADELERWKQYAKTLRTLLSSQGNGYTWSNAARTFSEALRLPVQSEVLTSQRIVTRVAHPQTSGSLPTLAAVPASQNTATETLLLKLPAPSWERERGHAESQLLRPEEFCVPFHEFRRQLFDEVIAWATAVDGLPAELQFHVGSAGAGKTRLMLEVCQALAEQGWSSGFLASDVQQDLEKAFKRSFTGQAKSFVVVDYAETRRRDVVDLMRAAFTAPKEARIRIVLLARDAGEWWDQFSTDHPSLEKFLTGRAVRGPYRIPEVPIGEQNRETIFREALKAFAARLNKDHKGILPPALSAPHFSNVLFIHLAAMASLSGERPETATNLLEATLRRERRYWHEIARAHGLPDSLRLGLDQAVAITTLRAGIKDAAEARLVLKSIPRLRGAQPVELDKVLDVLRIFYPAGGGVDALRPDILGERLISQELAKDDALLEVALGQNANATVSRSALTVLNRLARQSPSDVLWLKRGLQQHLELRSGIAVTVAIEAGDPIGKVLAEVLKGATVTETWGLIEPLRSKMPHETIALRECALVLAQLRLKQLENKGSVVGDRQKMNLAQAYLDFGNRLSAVDEYRKALDAYRSARFHFQSLVRVKEKHGEHLAGCLSNESFCLAELGKHEEAFQGQQAAVNILRKLVASRPGAFKATLALALGNLSLRRRMLGYVKDAYLDAQGALDLYRLLEKTAPERFRPKVARLLLVVSAALSDLGQHEEALSMAQQSFPVCQGLADEKPDAFQVLLAFASLRLAGCWNGLGRYDQAREEGERAVEIFRKLFNDRPEAFRGDFSHALVGLAGTLRVLGRPREALALGKESLDIQADYSNVEPNAARQWLAIARDEMAHSLADLGLYAEALQTAEEGLNVLRGLVRERFEALRLVVLDASSLVARILISTGSFAKAHAILELDKQLLEGLCQGERARVAVPVRAEFLATLALVQFRLNVIEESVGNSRLATALFDEYLDVYPFSCRAAASWAWCVRSSCEAAIVDVEKSQSSAVQGLELLHAELVETPRRLSPWMLEVARDLIRLAGSLGSRTAHSAVFDAIAVDGVS